MLISHELLVTFSLCTCLFGALEDLLQEDSEDLFLQAL